MPGILEVTSAHIANLNDHQLMALLRRLLHLEVRAKGIPESSVSASLNIYAPDGGEDAHVEWQGGPSCTDYLPHRRVLFQCKAGRMPKEKCHDELLRHNTSSLKPRVEKVLEVGGTYVLFNGKESNEEQDKPKLIRMREALVEAGKPYHATADLRIYAAHKIAAWTNRYLSAVRYVFSELSVSMPSTLLTWDEWASYEDSKFQFVEDAQPGRNPQAIREALGKPRSVVRLVGLSGLGKTRLALEALRPPDDPVQDVALHALSQDVVYTRQPSAELVGSLIDWRRRCVSGVLVVDDCDIEVHRQLRDEITHRDNCGLSLLTMDYTLTRCDDQHPYIELACVSDETIRAILRQAYGDSLGADLDRIVQFADGWPQMAVLLTQSRLQDRPDIGTLRDEVILNRLLWQRTSPDDDAREVISACALFERIGWEEEVTSERRFIAEEICQIDAQRFYALANRFRSCGILDSRGRYVRVVPQPLAIRLAADWLESHPREQFDKILMQPIPAGLFEAMSERMSKLHFSSAARRIVHALVGAQAPFGRAEALGTEAGSRLFRSFVEVNPQDTVNALYREFAHLDREQLLQVGPGRRNLVWALEKLCFWEGTFPKAARTLLAFASAENEKWSNNATGQFLQLFRCLLSGTKAPPELRLSVADDALGSDSVETRVLGIRALGEALTTHHFARAAGAEIQGTRPIQSDWRPSSGAEVHQYWEQSLSRLLPIAQRKDELGELVRAQIAEHLQGLLIAGCVGPLSRTLDAVGTAIDIWPGVVKAIQEVLDRQAGLSPDLIRLLETWREVFRPVALADRLRFVVTQPDARLHRAEDGSYVDLASSDAASLSEDCARTPSSFYDCLNVVFEGQQRQGWAFGDSLGRHILEPEEFVDRALRALAVIPAEKADPTVLGAFLGAVRQSHGELVTAALDRVGKTSGLAPHLVRLTALSHPERDDLARVLSRARVGAIEVEGIRALAYGSVLAKHPPETAVWFSQELRQLDAPHVALEILHFHCFSDADKTEACAGELRDVMLTRGLLTRMYQSSGIAEHAWSDEGHRLAQRDPGDDTLVVHLAEEIIRTCSEREAPVRLQQTLADLLHLLLSTHYERVWPIFGEALLGDQHASHMLEMLLNPRTPTSEAQDSLLGAVPVEHIIEWCQADPERRAPLLPRLVPLTLPRGEEHRLHPLIFKVLAEFGSQEEVLLEIRRHVGPRVWWGSLIPYLERSARALQELQDHPNAKVRCWARSEVDRLNAQIREERKRDDEEEIGVP